MKSKIIFIPGNGGGSPKDNWFPSVKEELEKSGLNIIAEEFPDNDLARASYWIPFVLNELKVDENTILVGHSSGAIAAMRIAERQKILGSVLVGAYHTHLNIDKEKQSGYFDAPWNWEAMKNNQQWTVLFASQDDPWIPIEEARYIHSQLNCEYHEYTDQGHFGGDYFKPSFPELPRAIIRNIQALEREVS
jgi:predicted alpha/beta hydrolase family esterase